MTRDDARAYFKQCGLTYQDITRRELRYLEIELNDEFNKVTRSALDGLRQKPLYWVRVNDAKHYKVKYDPNDGHMLYAFITASGTYFKSRLVIDFNPNGYIGFCIAADDKNTEPVIEAFVSWCDWLKARRTSADEE